MGLFDSVFELVKDVGTIVTTPVTAVVDLVSIPVKEVADVMKDLSNDIKSLKD